MKQYGGIKINNKKNQLLLLNKLPKTKYIKEAFLLCRLLCRLTDTF